MRSVEVTIKPDGSIEIEAVGFKGGACEKATEAVEKALGVVASRRLKPEHALAGNGVGQPQRT